MQIAFTGAPDYMDRSVGYGEASYHIYKTFERHGIQCVFKNTQYAGMSVNDLIELEPEFHKPNIGLSFIFPHEYSFGPNQYKIGYTPWESTGIFPNWKKPLNAVDEMWTTSEWCADIFSKHTTKPIFVFKHGVTDDWIPQKRVINPNRPFRFLHIGEPASRKDAQLVVDVFLELFDGNKNVELVLKCSGMNTTRIFDKKTGQSKGSPSAFHHNIKTIESYITTEQINGLYDLCDVFVYPSWGEGFGLNPLQAIAKGIPTISTHDWATYAKYITLPVDGKWATSPWPETHPGKMIRPEKQHLKEQMLKVYNEYQKYSAIAYRNAFLAHRDYNWDKVSKPAIKRLKEIQKSNF